MRQKSTFFLIIHVFVFSATPTPAPIPPSKIQGVTVTRTVQGSSPALRVSWSTVSGSGITYTVCYSTTSGTQSDPPSGANCGTSGITGTSTTLGPLSGGTTYYIWAAAVSSGGQGPYSDRQQERTYQVPSRVNPPSLTKTVTSGKPALRVTWTAPFSERPITKYQVQYRISGSTSWRGKNGTSTSITLENLSTGTSYQVQVRAVSDIGSGSYSEIRTITTYGVPSQVGPPVLTKAASSGRPALIVTWTTPSSDRPITRYQVQYRRSVSTSWSTKDVTSTSTTLERLSAGTSYQVQVRAVSDVGSGPYSPKSTKTTYRVPEEVTGVGFTLDNANNVLTLTIIWDSPSSELPITRYWVRIEGAQLLMKVLGVTTLAITGTPGRTYTFSIIAQSAVGFGEWSESVTAQPPSQPAINVTTPSTTTLTVRWDDEGFSYRLVVQKKGSTEINTFRPVTPPYNITGLESNTEYTVVIEAYNLLGSANGSVVGYTLPEVPVGLVLEVLSSTSIRVTWTPPPNAERLPLTYHVGYSSEFTAERSTPTKELPLVLTGLHPFDVYTVTVEAANTGGRGGPTTKEAQTLSDVPTVAPKNVTVVRINNSAISVSWIPLTLQEARGWPVYTVFWESSSQRAVCAVTSVNTSDSSVVIGNLDPASTYSVVVQVSTAAGTSEELKSQPVVVEPTSTKKNQLGADSDASSDGLSAGLFIAGLFSGVIALLLVEGIICGVCKISKMSQKKNIEGDYADPTNIQMRECPAYESIDREGKSAERLYDNIESRYTK